MSRELPVQPRPGKGPFAFGGDGRHIENRGGFIDREAAKEPQFHEACLPLIEAGKLVEGRVKGDHVGFSNLRGYFDALERHGQVGAPLRGRPGTRVVDQHAAHRLRRDRKEVGAILPAHTTLIDELQIRFVDERRGGE